VVAVEVVDTASSAAATTTTTTTTTYSESLDPTNLYTMKPMAATAAAPRMTCSGEMEEACAAGCGAAVEITSPV